MKRLFLMLAGLCLLAMPSLAQGDTPRAELFGGYSYLRTDKFMYNSIPKGWAASVVGNLHRNFGVEADFSGHYQSQFGVNQSNHLFLFGPKVAARLHKLTPWAHVLSGASLIRARAQSSTVLGPADRRASETSFAWAIGGGLDANVHKNVAIRIVQADYIRNASLDTIQSGSGGTYIQVIPGSSNNVRLSFGIVFQVGGQ